MPRKVAHDALRTFVTALYEKGGLPPSDAALIAFLAYPATLLGGGIWSWLLGRHPASTVAPFTLLVPITGLLSGYLILGETITMVEIAGGVLVIIGLVVTLRKAKPLEPAIRLD